MVRNEVGGELVRIRQDWKLPVQNIDHYRTEEQSLVNMGGRQLVLKSYSMASVKTVIEFKLERNI